MLHSSPRPSVFRKIMRDASGNVYVKLSQLKDPDHAAEPEWLASPVGWGYENLPLGVGPTPADAVGRLATELGIPTSRMLPHDEATSVHWPVKGGLA